METGSKNGQMDQNMKEIGQTIKQTGKANYSMLMGMSMRENGVRIKPMGKELTSIRTGPNIKEIGEMISSMDSALRHGLMEQSTKEVTLMERRMGRVS
jgi:hypothetical protein